MRNKLKWISAIFLTIIFSLFVPAAAVIDEGEATSTANDEYDSVITVPKSIVYIPFRSTIEQLGGIVEYDKSSGYIMTIMPNETRITHIPGSEYIEIDGFQEQLTLPSIIEDGVTYLSLTDYKTILKSDISYDHYVGTISVNEADIEETDLFNNLLEYMTLEHYIPNNLFKYIDYIDKYPDIPIDISAAYVNAAVDKVFYSDVEQVAYPDSILVMCNKNYSLPEDYVPEDLVYIVGTGYQLRKEAAEHYTKMNKAAKSEGIYFTVYSSYRSYSTQEGLFERYSLRDGVQVAETYSARPGHSEHQAGLAVDLASLSSNSSFENTREYSWLLDNAHKYGFILRYPDEYSDITGYKFESWHWRYIGADAATRMHEEGIATYEEYCGKYLMNLDHIS